MEICEGNGLRIANSFIPGAAEEKATFMEPGSTFLWPTTEQGYNTLDLLLCDSVLLARCCSLQSMRLATLATDHYLVIAVFQLEVPEKNNRTLRHEIGSLRDASVRQGFAAAFNDAVRATADVSNCRELWQATKVAMNVAAATLPRAQQQANKPWISEPTLRLLDLRREAREQNDVERESVDCTRRRGKQRSSTRRDGLTLL